MEKTFRFVYSFLKVTACMIVTVCCTSTVLLALPKGSGETVCAGMPAGHLIKKLHFPPALWPLEGKIVGEKGEPVPSATVVVKSTSKAVVSDAEGNFTVEINGNGDSISISSVGYETKTISVSAGGDRTITVVLSPDLVSSNMNEVIVVGYGAQKKANLTGAVATMNARQLATVPAGNVSNLLAGNLPGLIAVQRSGEPGNDQPQLSIRGFGNALVVVDGIVGRDFSRLDPNEIETITILKDAASTSVYGVSGGNGVILVTTKKGKIGRPEMAYTANFGVQHVTDYPRFVNSAEFAILKNEASVNIGGAPVYSDEEIEKFRDGSDPVNYPNADYYNIFVRDYTPQIQHNITVRGGNERIKYFFLLGKFNQKAMWNARQDYGKYNFRSNVEAQIDDNLSISVDIGGRSETRNGLIQDAYLMSSWMQYQWPIENPKTPDGKIQNTNYGLSAYLDEDLTGYSDIQDNSYQGNLTINYKIPFIPGLAAKVTAAHDLYMEDVKTWTKEYGLYTWNPATETSEQTGAREINALYMSNSKSTSTRIQASLNYNRRFLDKHNVTALLLYEELEDKMYSLGGSRINYIVPIDQIFAGPLLNQSNSGSASDNGRQSYVGRVNYDYLDKYLLEYSFRYDGSPKFPVDKRWGFFSGISAGWRLSEERFIKDNFKSVDNLKIRGSWGKLGNDNTGAFQYLTGYTYPAYSYILGGTTVTTGLADAGLPNPNITWEQSKMVNLGIELGMWKRLLEVEADVFHRRREGLLAKRSLQLPSTFGATLPFENLNSDDTKGFELVVGHNNQIGKVVYNVSANVSFTKSKWINYESREFTSSDDNWRNNFNGRFVNRYFGLKAIGQFQSQEDINSSPIQDGRQNSTLLPGDIKYDDFNGDGVIDNADQQPLGRGETPEISYGLGINLSWRRFSMSMNLQGAANFVINLQQFLIQPFANNMNTYAYFMDRWHRADPKDPTSDWIPGKYPATRNDGAPNNTIFSSFWLKDASYVRLRSLNLNYNLEQPILQKIGIKDINIFVSGQNLLTLKKLKYIDPETPTGRLSVYPLQKTYNAGFSVTF